MNPNFAKIVVLVSAVFSTVSAFAAPQKVAILGDSITYNGTWATLVESALRATPQFADAEIVNFGLSSETVSGLSEDGHADGKFPRPDLHERLDRILEAFQPQLVLACYGMNDGIYLPLDAERMKAWQVGSANLKKAVEKQGGRLIFISAPLYHADSKPNEADFYDAVLDAQAAWLRARRADGWEVIDIRPDLKKNVADAKKADPAFVYASDGVHPGERGHFFIAESIVKQLWPLLKLPESPHFANGEALKILTQRHNLLKLAWLSKTGHQRPGIPAGLALDEANAQAATLLEKYVAASKSKT